MTGGGEVVVVVCVRREARGSVIKRADGTRRNRRRNVLTARGGRVAAERSGLAGSDASLGPVRSGSAWRRWDAKRAGAATFGVGIRDLLREKCLQILAKREGQAKCTGTKTVGVFGV
jgi:hypothetical protein